VPVLLVAFLPWSATLLWSAILGIKQLIRTRCTTDATCWLLCWAGFCVAFFSVAQSKLPGYILPAFPPMGLLMARSCIALAPSRRLSFRFAHFSAAAILLLAFASATTGLASRLNAGFAAEGGIVVAVFAVANLLIGFFADRLRENSRRGIFAAAAVLPIVAALLLACQLIPFFFYYDPSGRTLARELQQQQIPADQVSVVAMKRGMQYSLSFYMHEEIKSFNNNSTAGGYLLTGGKNCEPFARPRFSCQRVSFDENDATGELLFRLIPLDSAAELPVDRQVR
jgi:4-amino-4-deoxy-L-arabinose transferase-like glycosyltransferase